MDHRSRFFYERFPFLGKIARLEDLGEFEPKRPELRLFSQVGGVRHELRGWHDSVDYFLVDSKGELTQVGAKWWKNNPNRRWFQFWKARLVPAIPNEPGSFITISEEFVVTAIENHSHPEDIMCVVMRHISSTSLHAPYYVSLTLYHAPRGMSILKWFEYEETQEFRRVAESLGLTIS